MTTAESSFKKNEIALMGVLALIAVTLVTVAVIPSFRTKIKETFISSDRDVIAKVSGSLSPEGPQVTILKIRSKNSLFLEVYTTKESGSTSLIAKLPLFETRDGYFLLRGNATNLALTDVDKDGNPEVVAPTYDEQMVPRLNIFKYNSTGESFDRMAAPEDYKP